MQQKVAVIKLLKQEENIEKKAKKVIDTARSLIYNLKRAVKKKAQKSVKYQTK